MHNIYSYKWLMLVAETLWVLGYEYFYPISVAAQLVLKMSLRVKSKSVSELFPYSTCVILLIVFLFKRDTLKEVIESNAFYLNISKDQLIVYFVVLTTIAIAVVYGIWQVVAFLSQKYYETTPEYQLDVKERNALITIFNALGGKAWKKNTSWCTEDHISHWKGVHVNPHTNRVVKLILADNNLSGSSAFHFITVSTDNFFSIGIIPKEIEDLDFLTEVDFRSNKLKGTIPESMCEMTRLEGIYLCDNFLEGIVLYASISIGVHILCRQNTRWIVSAAPSEGYLSV